MCDLQRTIHIVFLPVCWLQEHQPLSKFLDSKSVIRHTGFLRNEIFSLCHSSSCKAIYKLSRIVWRAITHRPFAGFRQHLETFGQYRIYIYVGSVEASSTMLGICLLHRLRPPSSLMRKSCLLSAAGNALLAGIVGKKGDAHPRFLFFYTSTAKGYRFACVCLSSIAWQSSWWPPKEMNTAERIHGHNAQISSEGGHFLNPFQLLESYAESSSPAAVCVFTWQCVQINPIVVDPHQKGLVAHHGKHNSLHPNFKAWVSKWHIGRIERWDSQIPVPVLLPQGSSRKCLHLLSAGKLQGTHNTHNPWPVAHPYDFWKWLPFHGWFQTFGFRRSWLQARKSL